MPAVAVKKSGQSNEQELYHVEEKENGVEAELSGQGENMTWFKRVTIQVHSQLQ